ncbi:hypothetical protein SLS57_009701 [Botryosphaeria dothidea]
MHQDSPGPAAAPPPPPPPPSPCPRCASAFTTSRQAGKFYEAPWSLLCSPDKYNNPSGSLRYSRRRGSLEGTAAGGCGLCQVLLDSVITGEKRRSNLKKGSNGGGEIGRAMWKKGWDGEQVKSMDGSEAGKEDEAEVHFEFAFEAEGQGSPVSQQQRLSWSGLGKGEGMVAAGDPLAEPQLISGDGTGNEAFSLPVCSLNSNRGTPEELAMVKSWVSWCDNGHRSCVRHRRALPSRVLDVAESDNIVRLVDTEGIEPEPYATLSYCWGKSQSVVTTTATIAEHMEELELSRLPQTLQDGVKTTRALGLKYLWVDSLCIIQDSVADREREIARMQQVFQNSHVTIVAARARDCHEGFFQAERSRDPLVKLPMLCANGQVGNMMLLPRKQRLIEQPTREPLHERGWTLQEIVLSPRLLIYGRELTVWRCTAGEKVHECSTGRQNPIDWNGYCAAAGLTTIRLSPRGRIHQPRLSTHSPPSMFNQQSERLPKLFRTWKFVVHDYTTRLLSDPMDKLPALGGIVTYFRDAMEDRYLAGLWEKHLLHELSWLPSPPSPASPITAATLRTYSSYVARPPSYRAPSWSWMSIDAAIAFQADACSWYEPVADVVDCAVTPAVPDAPFSRVAAGVLTLHGFLRPNVPTLLSPRTPFAVAGVDDAAAGAYGVIYLDVPDEESCGYCSSGASTEDGSGSGSSLSSSRRFSQGVYWCFMLARCFTRTPAEDDEVVDIETVWGLALALKGEEFERVGYFVGGPQCRTWFESGGKRDVTIV